MEKNRLEDTIYILEDFYGNNFDIKTGDEIGKILRGKYLIKKLLSSSANSKLYLVEYENKEYVAKIMLEENSYSYLENENKILEEFSSPSMIQAINFYEANRIEPPILLLEYIKGSKLSDYKENSIHDKIKLVLDLTKAYYELERNNLIHGDIKNDNIIIDENGSIKLIDFGLGNKYNVAQGSVKYMSPETLFSSIKDIQSEIYSLSLNIFEFIYNYPYNELDIKNSIALDKIPLGSDIYLRLILAKGLAKEREFRYKSFYELLINLEKYYFILKLYEKDEVFSKEKFLNVFTENFPNDLLDSFFYDYYKSKKNMINNLENLENLDFLIEYYIEYENYRLTSNFNILYEELNKIFNIENVERLRTYIINKINTKLDLLDFSQELNRASKLEKQMLFKDLIDLYRNLASKGSREAEYNLAFIYKEGKNVDQNIKKAFYHFENLAKIKYPQGIYQIALMYQKGEGCEKDLKKSKEYLEEGANLGHLGCQNSLGIAYRYAYGVEKDINKAFYWYEKSALGGHVGAQNNVGFMHKNGLGVEQSYEKAFYWYKLSAESGNSSAQVNLAFMYKNGLGIKKDLKEAFHWYKKASEQGNISAQVNLGKFYQEGWTVPRDYKLAVKLYQAGVNAENEQAMTYYAYLLQHGFGTNKDEAKAKNLYEKAIKNGFSLAQYYYGKFLIEGSIKDYELGLKYLKKASKQKNAEAQLYIAKLYIEGRGVEKSFVSAKKWYEIAVEDGSSQALYELGKIYFEGKEALQNYKKAFDYVYKSAKQGNSQAQSLLGHFYEHGYGVKKDLGEALMWKNLSGEFNLDNINFDTIDETEKEEEKNVLESLNSLDNKEDNSIVDSSVENTEKSKEDSTIKKSGFFKKKWFNK